MSFVLTDVSIFEKHAKITFIHIYIYIIIGVTIINASVPSKKYLMLPFKYVYATF